MHLNAPLKLCISVNKLFKLKHDIRNKEIGVCLHNFTYEYTVMQPILLVCFADGRHFFGNSL